jgi:hypothetical protein
LKSVAKVAYFCEKWGKAKYHLFPSLGIMIGIRPQVDVGIRLQVGLLLLSNL